MFQPPKAPTYDPNFAYGGYTPEELLAALDYASNMAVVERFPETDERYDAYRQSYLRAKPVVRRSIGKQAQDTADKKREALPGALRYGQEGDQLTSPAARSAFAAFRPSQALPDDAPLLPGFRHMSVSSPASASASASASARSTQLSHAQRQSDERALQQAVEEANRYATTFLQYVADPTGNIAQGAYEEYLRATLEDREALWDKLGHGLQQREEITTERALSRQIEEDAEAYANFSVALTDNVGNPAFYQAAYERYMAATPEARAALSEALSQPSITPNMEPVSSHTPPLSFRAPSPVRDREISEAVYVQRIVHALNGHITADDAREMYQSALQDAALPQLIDSLIEIEASNAASNSPRSRSGRP